MRSTAKNSIKAAGPVSFKTAYCEHFRCPPEQFESSLFWRCLFRHALPFAAMIRRSHPDFFAEDMDLIREVGWTTTQELFRNEINYYFGRNLRDKNWLRTAFRIRVSGGRLVRLRKRLFASS